MPITELLEMNAKEFGSETALVEINPEVREVRRVTWKEYDLIELYYFAQVVELAKAALSK